MTAHSVSVVLWLVWTPTRVVAKAPSAAANSIRESLDPGLPGHP